MTQRRATSRIARSRRAGADDLCGIRVKVCCLNRMPESPHDLVLPNAEAHFVAACGSSSALWSACHGDARRGQPRCQGAKGHGRRPRSTPTEERMAARGEALPRAGAVRKRGRAAHTALLEPPATTGPMTASGANEAFGDSGMRLKQWHTRPVRGGPGAPARPPLPAVGSGVGDRRSNTMTMESSNHYHPFRV